MYPTAEVRWFYSGRLPPVLSTWFHQLPEAPYELQKRIDIYLKLTARSRVGIKLREGNIEVKLRRGGQESVRLHESVSGGLELWRKYSLARVRLGGFQEAVVATGPWIHVKKERYLRRFELEGQHGCELEVTRLEVAGESWWSLAFEAFGDQANLRQDLLTLARHLFAIGSPLQLEAEHSYSYPSWLERLGKP